MAGICSWLAGTPSLTATTTVTVTVTDVNEPPVLLQVGKLAVAENSPPGTLIGTLNGKDEDRGDRITYSVRSSADATGEMAETIAGVPWPIIDLDESTGVLRVADWSTAPHLVDLLNFEMTPKWTLIVTVTDLAGLASSSALPIEVLDVNEPPSLKTQEAAVDEDAAPGTVLGEPLTSPKYVQRSAVESVCWCCFGVGCMVGLHLGCIHIP